MNDKRHGSGQTPADAAALRKRAEEQARFLEPMALSAQTPEEIQRVFHEHQVHQIELEMQNEQLRTAQDQIEAGRARYFDLYGLAPVGYLTLSEQGLILEANLFAATLLGTTRGLLVKQPLTRFILKEDQDIYYLHRKQPFEPGEPRECALRLVKPDGALFWAQLTETVDQAENGAPTCRVMISDITERKQVEARLQESLLRYELVLAGASGGIWDWDVPNKRVHYSPGWKAMRGYADDEIGDSETEWSSAIHPEDAARVMAAIEAHFAGQTDIFEQEYRVRRKDGAYVWLLDRGKAFCDDAGQVVRMAGSEIDITERKHAEQEHEKLLAQLAQSQKMESVGRLAGGVAHDFNNMLNVILGRAEMALEALPENSVVRADLEEIEKAAERSAELTRQLLAFARKQTVAPRVFDLNDAVGSLLKMLGRLVGEDIELSFTPHRAPLPMEMDPSQLDQILANLCVNARDAIGDTGEVIIETSEVEIDEAYCAHHGEALPGPYARLVVSDTGCGMSKETVSHLFEPFFTTKAVGKGTGLGLATVYGIVKQNNGFINVYSEPGQGTTFKLYLPRYASKDERRGPSRAPAKAATGHETILAVEDEPMILEMATSMLSRQGYTVLAAKTPGEALELAREHTGELHLLLTDVIMPEMNGRELARRLLALYPDLRRLFMSGYTANVIAHHGVLDEGVCFLQKPFTRSTLAARVREALGRE